MQRIGNQNDKLPLTKERMVSSLKNCKGNLANQDASLSNSTLISSDDDDLKNIELILGEFEKKLEDPVSRAMATFICSVLGDSLGCNTEFSPFKYDKSLDFQNFADFQKIGIPRAEIGQWTDDTSMALCVADSLLTNQGKFDGADMRLRFLMWWHFGYNNGRKNQRSFGLGGNIAESFVQFQDNFELPAMEPTEMNKKNNGNGSLMRLAPVPIYFHNDESKGMEYAESQSHTTHTGEEAAECCRLLTHLIIRLINRPKNSDFSSIFENLHQTFQTDCKSVEALAASAKESGFQFDKFNQVEGDRNWDWRSQKYEFSSTRWKQNPGYFGSYCMDALALSLHYAYHSKSATEAILRAINYGGDSDTVGAITGQIVGACYGLEPGVMKLYKEQNGLSKWDQNVIATTAYKLFHHKDLKNPTKFKLINFLKRHYREILTGVIFMVICSLVPLVPALYSTLYNEISKYNNICHLFGMSYQVDGK